MFSCIFSYIFISCYIDISEVFSRPAREMRSSMAHAQTHTHTSLYITHGSMKGPGYAFVSYIHMIRMNHVFLCLPLNCVPSMSKNDSDLPLLTFPFHRSSCYMLLPGHCKRWSLPLLPSGDSRGLSEDSVNRHHLAMEKVQ